MTAAVKPTAAHTPGPLSGYYNDVIAERDALRAEVERLRAALQEVARIPADYDVCPQIAMRMYDAARAALGGGK